MSAGKVDLESLQKVNPAGLVNPKYLYPEFNNNDNISIFILK
jgi:hypothetical protein